MNSFAKRIMEHKYSHTKSDGTKETWEEIAYRVTKHVMKAAGLKMNDPLTKRVLALISARKFIPGGRYLYASGRSYHQVQNCLLLRAEDSREGWADLLHRASMALMTGAGIGVVYSDIRAEGKPIRRTGGFATGPLALMQMMNEVGRGIMQGGSRRSAIWAGLHWDHADAHKFIRLKNWSADIKAMKEKDYNAVAPLDGTNISIILDTAFFEAYNNEKDAQHAQAQSIYWGVVRQMLETGEPGFSIDTGVNEGENLRNACVTGDTEILTDTGYHQIQDLVGKEVNVWNGFEWSAVNPMVTGHSQEMVKVTLSDGRSLICTLNHKFVLSTDYRGGTTRTEAADLIPGDKLIKHKYPVLVGGEDVGWAYSQGFLSGDGMDDYPAFQVYGDKVKCIPRMHVKVGAFSESQDRTYVTIKFDRKPKSFVPMSWSAQSKLDWLAGLIDSDGTRTNEGGCQIASVDHKFLANVQKLLSTLGVPAKVCSGNAACERSMPDGRGGIAMYQCQETKRILIGATQIQDLLALGLRTERVDFEASPQRDAARFTYVVSVEPAGVADTVYCFTEPKRNLGCFNGIVTGQCTEVTSKDDSDICNLGSINMAQIESLEDMKEAVEVGTAFLLAGTLYSDVPYPQVDKIRNKNRRLGLGLMGLHEWLLKNNQAYAPSDKLAEYLDIYKTSTEVAKQYAKQWEISVPVKTRAIAPTGTIGIVAETTTGVEPVFCVAFKRRYLKGNVVNYEYVIDPCAKRLIDGGMNPDAIEDAYSVTPEKRVSFQAWLQSYVDHAISSTINLPAWGSETNNDSKVQEFGRMLMEHLPKLRGITVYPDGSRGGQPLSPVKYGTAIKHLDQVFVEGQDICDLQGKGTCGS